MLVIDRLFQAAYPGASESVAKGQLSRTEALALSRQFIQHHHPDAIAAYGFGSAFSDNFRPHSDLDLVVVLPESTALRSRCLMFDGVPIEAHIFGADGIDPIIHFSRRHGNATVLLPVAHGEVLVDSHGQAEEIKRRFIAAFAAGPGGADPKLIDTLRHFVTTQLLDLSGGLVPAEALMVATGVYPSLLQLLFLSSRTWRHRGKWAVRYGEAIVQEMSAKVAQAYAKAVAGDFEEFMALAVGILDRAGGPLWAGHEEELVLQKGR